MIPEYRHDRCVPPSRECGSWWRRLVDHQTQFGAKMGQKKAFQDILKNYFSCVKAKCFIALWNFLNKHVAYKIIKLEEVREIKQRGGISAPLFLTACECRGMWLPQLTLAVGFPVACFPGVFQACFPGWPVPPSADYPSMSAGRVQETFPVAFCWHPRDSVGRSEGDHGTLPQLVWCLRSAAMCWADTEW